MSQGAASGSDDVRELTEHPAAQQGEQPTTGFKTTPPIPKSLEKAAKPAPKPQLPPPEGPKATVNFEALPIPAFINAIYGDILKMSFEIDSALKSKTDLVSLRATEALAPAEIDSLARQVLSNYGVAIDRQGNILRFQISKTAAAGEPPLLLSGRALPEVPISHRPVFQLMPLTTVRNTNVTGWLRQAFKGQPLEILEDIDRNAILLMGPPEVVGQAVEATRMLDQPFMRGSRSMRIEPVFMNAQELSDMLVNVLNAEGYSAGMKGALGGSIIVLPIAGVNAVLVFASDDTILEHARQWAASLDKPGRIQSPRSGIFYYLVKNTRAAELAKVLEKMLAGNGILPKVEAPQKTSSQNPHLDGAAAPTSSQPQASQKLVVDEMRNGLIFQGDTNEWEALLPVIREMDRPTRMVMISVTVAEVTLTDNEQFGIEWLFKDVKIGDVALSAATSGLGVGSNGLTFQLNNAGQTQATLNAFASRKKVKILSSPRVMVKSGGEAKIDVGTEVPIVTSQSTSPDQQQTGNTGILQQIQYRKTGALLSVKPVIHSGNRIDIEISQEVSEVQPSSNAKLPSPDIFTRKIETSMGLQDGGSVLLGGLISASSNTGHSTVPGLGDIPILGRMFGADSKNSTRTELIMLIVPYVISSNEEAISITESMRGQFPNVLSK